MIRNSKICLSLFYNYMLPTSTPSDEPLTDNEFRARDKNLKSMAKVLEGYGGLLTKVSQLLTIEDANNSSFSECNNTFSSEDTKIFFENFYDDNKDDFFKDVKSIDFNVINAGSVGQIHTGIVLFEGVEVPVVFKVQYMGLKEQMESDTYLLNMFTNYLYGSNFTDVLDDIKIKLRNEITCDNECDNQELISQLYNDDKRIIIPKIFRHLSNDIIICMEHVKGISFPEFVKTGTQEERNHIGRIITEFTFKNIYKHKLFYSDIHYGNFIIKGDRLCILDFGALHKLDDDLVDKFIKLHKTIINKDKEAFYQCVRDLEIITDELALDKVSYNSESFEYLYNYFNILLEPFISDDFDFGEENLKLKKHKNTELMGLWNLPPRLVYFSKIPFGLIYLLAELKIKCDFTNFFKQLLE